MVGYCYHLSVYVCVCVCVYVCVFVFVCMCAMQVSTVNLLVSNQQDKTR